MKNIIYKLLGLLLFCSASILTKAQINAQLLGRYSIGTYNSNGGVAEISAYDPGSKRMFVINGPDSSVKIVNIANPASPVLIATISVKPYGIDVTSVACNKKGVFAISVIDSNGKTNPSNIVFLDINGNYINKVKAGANADHVIFTPNGQKLLVANEGEPNVGYTIDPEGSISIIDLASGIANITQANVQTAGFTAFNSPTVIDSKIRIFGKIQSGTTFSRNSTVAEDLEPEYIAISDDNTTAWVTCQENNALAVVNINTATVTSLLPLGYKNHRLAGNGLDPSDRDNGSNAALAKIDTFPVFGMFLPDGISHFKAGNQSYLVTANEGDARADYGTANNEENRVADVTYVLDSTKFGGAAGVAAIKANTALGRLTVSNRTGDFNNDGKIDSIFCFGARSFSIWNGTTGALVWDSKDEIEQKVKSMFPANFNTGHTTNALDDRSDNKGPEPESVTIGKIKDSTYAFIGLERIGGIMIYNITIPTAPYFVQYINTRNFSVTPSQANLASVGDLGPEGIVFIPASESPNGVNMIMLSNEVSGTVAIFNINTPETEGISKLQDYKNNTSAAIGTFQGINYKEAGFSTLFPIPNTNGTEFWTCSDRGVNIDCANANTASCRPTYDKMYAFPSYSPKIHRIRINGDSIQILQTIPIKRPNGSGASGIINPTGLGSTAAEIASTDTVLNCANFSLKTTPKDTFGIDPEGLVVDKNGDFWLCEEGGATIWKLNKNGVLVNRFTPYAHLSGKQAVDIQIDSVFKYRKNNRGFEGISIAPNGKIYAMIQSGIQYPTVTIGDNTRIHRILEIDPATNNQRMLVYLNDGIIGTGSNQIRLRDWKIGDMAAVNDSTFLVLEAAARGTSDIKRLYQININQATAVHSGLYGTLTLEGLVDSTGLANNGIKPVTKTLVMDLLASGWPAELDKAEGLAIINDSTIAIGNDNDFGQTSPLANGIATATGNLSHLITYRLSGAKKLANYKPSVLSVSTQSAYLTPEAPGVKIDPILTVGDEAQNGYKLVGLGDGTGAFDNGNGTFTFLVSHEINNLLGVNRAHGAKGAFVSKWVINKNDLSVVSGADLIQKVNIYTPGVGYTLYNPADTTSKKAFSRFCSSDLPSISAFYNALTGLGTQERIFMNGEESGIEGRAFGHIVTGANAGTTYELPYLGKFSWENSIASNASGDKTVVAGTDDGTDGQVYFYVGTKTNAGNEMDKAGLTNGRLYGISVTGLPAEISATVPAPNTTFSMVDLGIVKDSTGLALNNRSNALSVTKFLRPEDGAFDPSNPNDFYFVTTNSFTAPSKMWRLRFTDIKNPTTGGTITAVLDGTEGPKMMDNIAIDNFGHVIIQEDPGNQTHLAKIWQYTIANDQIKMIASHDSSRFITGSSNFLTQDEESSGVIDVQDILGAGNFLLVDQAHYGLGTELVEGGQMLKMFNPSTANKFAGVAPNSSQTPYLTPAAPGVKFEALLTAGDSANNGYKMAGLGDGTGAFDNGNGTFTFLVSHEINNLLGVNRAHGAKGAFVSKWVINKNDLSVVSGADLIQKVNIYTPGVGYTLYNPADTTSKKAFSRFCSSDLPSISAFYNALTGLGTQERIFMNGEESGIEGRAFGHIVTGANAGTTYELPYLGKFSWENSIASNASGDKTVVAGTDDGTDGQVYFYVGTKTNAGNEMDKAGLTNGRLYGISVTGLPAEISATVPAPNTTFSMVDLGIVKDSTGLALNNRSNALSVTKFLRPEDGAFDPSNPNDFYFVTTNSFTAPSKMWRLRFNDIKNPTTGGTITAVLDGTEGPKMMDNIAIDNFGHVIIQEDPGNQTHLAKIWQYTIANDQIKMIASHDSSRFIAGRPNFLTQDEESSGVIDVQDILGAGNFLLVDQAHYGLGTELVEGGQMLKMFVPTNNYTLQVLHSSDMESSIDAVIDAPNFAAVMNKLEDTYPNTVKLASGDCFIPSPFLSAGEDASIVTPLRSTASSYFSGSTAGLRAAIGRVDVSMMNIMGFQGSALGNHEFDLGTSEVNSIIGVDIRSNGADKRWIGAQFPYLSANLDFSGDANLSYLYTNKRLSVDSFKTSPTITANSQKKGLAPSSIVIVNGEKIGLVGATTQLLENISSPGFTKVVGSKTDNMPALAAILQPVIDSLRFVEGINKIIVMSHLQQLANEKALAPLLKGVDIIIAGGSHSLCADGNDRLRAGNVAADKYPIMTQNNDNEPLAILNTTAEWKYVGRFVANFTEAGVLIPSLLDSVINGAYAADTAMVTSLWGNYNSAFATGTKAANVRILCAAIGNVIVNKDGNKFGKSSVFLEGRRDFVRTQETNLGNVSSDANLWLAKKYDSQVRVSIKNGGGIRSAIGQVVSIGNGVQLLPTAANPTANKNVGDISQLDIENSLRFNNKLSIVSVNAAGLKRLLEHGVSASKPGITPGQFPQVGGVMFSYDTTRAAGSKIQSMVLVDSIGNRLDTIVRNGVVYGDTSRTIKVVTLDFLAGGGDSYPFVANGFNRINLDTAFKDSLYAKFQANGTEQDAFADYMYAKHNSTPFAVRDTNLLGDNRIQLLNARQDGIFPPVVPVISIAAARALPTDTVKVRGIITRAWGRFIYIQDGTGAIGVRQSSGAMVDSIVSGGLKAGDSVEVSGGRSDFNNYSQIALQSGLYRGKSIINKIMSNRPLPPVQLLTVKQLLANPEAYESELIRIENLRTSSTGNFAASTNHNVWDGTTTGDTTIFRVISAADTEIEDAPALAVPTGLFTFEGTLIQFCSSPTSGCTNGYQLQGVRKGDILPQIVIPVLGLFNLANPANNSRIVTDSASTTSININWTKSTNATLYKWMLTSQAGTFTAPLLTLLSNNAGVDSTLTLSSGSVDAILAGLGIAKGDSVNTKWTVFAYKSLTDSLQASQVFNLTLARSKVVLGAFNLSNPTNNTTLVLTPNSTTPVVINWTASANATKYTWKAATLAGNFNNPLLNLNADNAGADTKLTLSHNAIDGILVANGVAKGDSIKLQWTVYASRSSDSLKAVETFNITLVRGPGVGVNNIDFKNNINVYPNPAQIDLFINSNNITGNMNVKLYSITGQLLIEENMEASMTNKINVSNLQDGIYMLSITGNNEKNATIKVVITH